MKNSHTKVPYEDLDPNYRDIGQGNYMCVDKEEVIINIKGVIDLKFSVIIVKDTVIIRMNVNLIFNALIA